MNHLARRSLLATPLLAGRVQAQPAPLVLCAVPGLQPGLQALEALWRAQGGRPLRLVFNASAALVRQLEQNGCDLLALDDPQRMDALEQRRLLKPDSRRDLLGNALVLVALVSQPPPQRLALPAQLPAALRDGRLALPDSASAAGRAARAALETLGLWEALAPRVVTAADPRAAAELLRRNEARYGVLLHTDAAAMAELRSVLALPAKSHPALAYPFALSRRADATAAELLGFLAGPDAAAVWQRHGLAPP